MLQKGIEMKEYNEQVVETLDDAGCIIANKNIIIDNLQAKNAELEKEVARLKAEENHLDGVVANWKETAVKLNKQLAIAEEHNVRLREAWNAIEINSEECLDFDECTAMLVPLDDYNAMSEALSIPASREALDAYVAEKVKEETDEYAALSDRLAKLLAETAVALKGEEAALTRHSWHDLPVVALAKMVEISELTRQRDLAVEALERQLADAKHCQQVMCNEVGIGFLDVVTLSNSESVLSSIKESELDQSNPT